MILELIKKHRWKLILTTICSASTSAIGIFLLDQITQNINFTDQQSLINTAIQFLFMLVILFVISFVSQFWVAKLGAIFVYQLRTQMLSQTSKISYAHLEKMGGHKILATLSTDINNISVALAVLPVFAVNLATVIFCMVYLLLKSSILFAYLIVGLLAGVTASVLIMRAGRVKFEILREKEDKLYSVFKTLVDGSKELNINSKRRAFFYNDLAEPSIQQVRDVDLEAKKMWILSDSLLKSVVFLVLGMVLYIAHTFYQIDPVVLTSFVLFTTYIITPINFLQSTFQVFIRGKIAYNKITSLDLKPSKSLQVESSQQNIKNWKKLIFKDVVYQYHNDQQKFQFAIGPINLTIQQGQNIFICGGNGSGKSTFAKVLVGLYQAQKGHIIFNDEVVTEGDLQRYRNHFSTIFSDFYLFEHVLDTNGLLVDDDSVMKHLKKLDLDKKVTIENGKVSSTKLSQGQRKRLAMLMAYMEDAMIYLFDEWAADQDPTFRAYFYQELLPELKNRGKTLIVITHDDKYFSLADKLLKFDNGKLTEQLNKSYEEQGHIINA